MWISRIGGWTGAGSWGKALHSGWWCQLFCWISSVPFRVRHKLPELSSPDKILDFVLQLNAIISIMIVVSMILAVLLAVLFVGIRPHQIGSFQHVLSSYLVECLFSSGYQGDVLFIHAFFPLFRTDLGGFAREGPGGPFSTFQASILIEWDSSM